MPVHPMAVHRVQKCYREAPPAPQLRPVEHSAPRWLTCRQSLCAQSMCIVDTTVRDSKHSNKPLPTQQLVCAVDDHPFCQISEMRRAQFCRCIHSPGGRSSAGESARTSHFRLRSGRETCGLLRSSAVSGGSGSDSSCPCSGVVAARRCSAARRASSAFSGDVAALGFATGCCGSGDGADAVGGGGIGGGGGNGPENAVCNGLQSWNQLKWDAHTACHGSSCTYLTWWAYTEGAQRERDL